MELITAVGSLWENRIIMRMPVFYDYAINVMKLISAVYSFAVECEVTLTKECADRVNIAHTY